MKRIVFWFGVLSTSLLQAQNVSVSYSNRFVLRDKGLTQKEGQTFRIGEHYFWVETDYKGMQLAYTARLKKVKYDVNIYRFDSTMKQTEKVAIDGQWSLGPFPPAPVYFSGKLLVFYYKVSENGDIHLLFSAVDPETMTVSAAKELNVFSEKNTGMFNIGKSFNLNTLSIAVKAAQRLKEVGIRKVLGAKMGHIVYLFSREFMVLIGIAFLIAAPIAWYFVHGWLRQYAFRRPIGVWVFGLGGLAAMVIALGTVSYQALRAAGANPVDNLRSE